MHRIDGPDNVGGMFSAGDPALGVPGTVVTPDWLNAVQEELVAVLTEMGVAPSKPDNGQVAAALPGYVDGRFAPGAWVPIPKTAGTDDWDPASVGSEPAVRKTADGTVQFRGSIRSKKAAASIVLGDVGAAYCPAADRGAISLTGSTWLRAGGYAPAGLVIPPVGGGFISLIRYAADNIAVNDLLILDGLQYVP